MRKKEVFIHLFFWFIYLALWSARDLIYHPDFLKNFSLNIIFNAVVAPFVYLNLYVLVPRFLFKRKFGPYLTLFMAGFLLTYWTRYEAYQFVFLNVLRLPDVAVNFQSWNGVVILMSENLITIFISMALFLIQQWYSKEKAVLEMKQKNNDAELKLLKSQLQPHFLFNNLNTIYFLTESNPELAKEVMLQFSDVLSHQLYNASKETVLLSEEIEYLRSYIKIQRLRHEDFLTLKYELPKDTGTLRIAPMILIAFIENAFKHGESENGYQVAIQLAVDKNELHLQVTNSIGQNNSSTKVGGVGLKNVKRRLALIYPNQHVLNFNISNEQYYVELKISLP